MAVCLFQFHKGTIKALPSSKPKYGNASFQFHKGTIKAYKLLIIQKAINKFQFHKGTIKACQKLDDKVSYRYFNSIKVQLKPA